MDGLPCFGLKNRGGLIMKKLGLLLLVVIMVLSCGFTLAASQELIKVGIVNLPPEESGYRQANVEDMNAVFSKENGYDGKQTNTADNSEQMAAATGYIRDGVDYLLISAANASGWDNVLQSAKRAGVKVILFDRAIDTDRSEEHTFELQSRPHLVCRLLLEKKNK